jgi:hypothetical protein
MTIKHVITTISVALVAFVFGCVTEALVTRPARAATTATRWQYTCQIESTVGGIYEDSNKFGAQGWELVTDSNGRVCWKRPAP